METKVLHIDDVNEHSQLTDWLTNLYGDNDGDYYGLALNMFQGDPDEAKMNGEFTLFIDVDIDSIKYVVYLNELEGINQCLADFFTDDYKTKFKESDNQSWDYFNAVDNAIAYRGGQGYSYNIYTF